MTSRAGARATAGATGGRGKGGTTRKESREAKSMGDLMGSAGQRSRSTNGIPLKPHVPRHVIQPAQPAPGQGGRWQRADRRQELVAAQSRRGPVLSSKSEEAKTEAAANSFEDEDGPSTPQLGLEDSAEGIDQCKARQANAEDLFQIERIMGRSMEEVYIDKLMMQDDEVREHSWRLQNGHGNAAEDGMPSPIDPLIAMETPLRGQQAFLEIPPSSERTSSPLDSTVLCAAGASPQELSWKAGPGATPAFGSTALAATQPLQSVSAEESTAARIASIVADAEASIARCMALGGSWPPPEGIEPAAAAGQLGATGSVAGLRLSAAIAGDCIKLKRNVEDLKIRMSSLAEENIRLRAELATHSAAAAASAVARAASVPGLPSAVPTSRSSGASTPLAGCPPQLKQLNLHQPMSGAGSFQPLPMQQAHLQQQPADQRPQQPPQQQQPSLQPPLQPSSQQQPHLPQPQPEPQTELQTELQQVQLQPEPQLQQVHSQQQQQPQLPQQHFQQPQLQQFPEQAVPPPQQMQQQRHPQQQQQQQLLSPQPQQPQIQHASCQIQQLHVQQPQQQHHPAPQPQQQLSAKSHPSRPQQQQLFHQLSQQALQPGSVQQPHTQQLQQPPAPQTVLVEPLTAAAMQCVPPQLTSVPPATVHRRASSLPPGPSRVPSAAFEACPVPADSMQTRPLPRLSTPAMPFGAPEPTYHIGPIPPLSACREAAPPFAKMGLKQHSFAPQMGSSFSDLNHRMATPRELVERGEQSCGIARARSAPSLGRGRPSVSLLSPRSPRDAFQVPTMPMTMPKEATGIPGGPSLSVPLLPPPLVPTLILPKEVQEGSHNATPLLPAPPSSGTFFLDESATLLASGFIAGGIPKAAPIQRGSAFHCGKPPTAPLHSVSRTSDGVPFEPPASEGVPRTGRLTSASRVATFSGQAETSLPRATTVSRLPDPLGWGH